MIRKLGKPLVSLVQNVQYRRFPGQTGLIRPEPFFLFRLVFVGHSCPFFSVKLDRFIQIKADYPY
jgi:hypothetical protein